MKSRNYLVGLCALLLSSTAFGESYTLGASPLQVKWPIESVNSIDIVADLGPVKVEGHDGSGIMLVARATGGEGAAVDVQLKNGILRIDASGSSSSSGSLFVKPQGPYSTISVNGRTYYIPGDSIQDISMVNDRLILDGVDVTDGKMKVSNAGVELALLVPRENNLLIYSNMEKSDLSLSNFNANEVTVSGSRGHVLANQIKARVQFNTTSGSLRVVSFEGELTGSTSSGDITVLHSNISRMRAETKSGNVVLNYTSGALMVSTTSGDVEIDGVPKGTVAVETRSGDIKLSAFEPVMKSARLSTMSGAVSKNTIEDTRSLGEKCSAIFLNWKK